MAFYLRFEGVNLSSFIEDAEDLSVSRGGSLVLLNAPDEVRRKLRDLFGDRVEDVNLGASSGIFRIDSTDPGAADRAKAEVRRYLENDTARRHATFVVDTAPDTGNAAFAADRARLMALNRWQQMQTQSLIYPETGGAPVKDVEGKAWRVCQKDLVRPAWKPVQHWNLEERKYETEIRSASVHARHEYGRGNKKDFFRKEFERVRNAVIPAEPGLEQLDYVNDLNTLAGNSGHSEPLRNKVAILYLDGNRFGAKFAAQCVTPEQQREKSAQLRTEQATFLTHLITHIHRNPKDWFFEGKDQDGKHVRQVRIEVLQWGGDEIALVVPAWKGLFALEFFFREARDWKTFSPLSHGAGVVFCSRKCHIHRSLRLAKELADLAKSELKRPAEERMASEETNLVVYQVLESFDHIGRRPDLDYMADRYPFLARDKPDALLLPGDKLGAIREAIIALQSEMPRRRLHEVVRSLMKTGQFPGSPEVKTLQPPKEATTSFNSLESACLHAPPRPGTDDGMLFHKAAWLHLQELWDYAVE
jgi:hypothetical protein